MSDGFLMQATLYIAYVKAFTCQCPVMQCLMTWLFSSIFDHSVRQEGPVARNDSLNTFAAMSVSNGDSAGAPGSAVAPPPSTPKDPASPAAAKALPCKKMRASVPVQAAGLSSMAAGPSSPLASLGLAAAAHVASQPCAIWHSCPEHPNGIHK